MKNIFAFIILFASIFAKAEFPGAFPSNLANLTIGSSSEITFNIGTNDINIVGSPGTAHQIFLGDATSWMEFVASTSLSTGAGLVMYGGSHATQAFDIEFYASNRVVFSWDESTDVMTLAQAGDNVLVTSSLEIDEALNHDGTTVGFYGVAPTAQAAAIADSAGDDATAVNAIILALENLGLIAS